MRPLIAALLGVLLATAAVEAAPTAFGGASPGPDRGIQAPLKAESPQAP